MHLTFKEKTSNKSIHICIYKIHYLQPISLKVQLNLWIRESSVLSFMIELRPIGVLAKLQECVCMFMHIYYVHTIYIIIYAYIIVYVFVCLCVNGCSHMTFSPTYTCLSDTQIYKHTYAVVSSNQNTTSVVSLN